jgi:hypothetical protein
VGIRGTSAAHSSANSLLRRACAVILGMCQQGGAEQRSDVSAVEIVLTLADSAAVFRQEG